MTNLYAVVDMTSSKEGVMKVVRQGNGYEWQVYGDLNGAEPLFRGYSGQFLEARGKGEKRLFKDLKEIFWLLSAASEKERREGEDADAELIEQTIRSLNAGDAKRALVFIDRAIKSESREREPEDVRRLQMARTLILDEPSQETQKMWPEPRDMAEKLQKVNCPNCDLENDFSRKTCSYCGYWLPVKKDTRYDPCPTCSSGHLGMLGGKPRDLKCPDCGGTGMKVTVKRADPSSPALHFCRNCGDYTVMDFYHRAGDNDEHSVANCSRCRQAYGPGVDKKAKKLVMALAKVGCEDESACEHGGHRYIVDEDNPNRHWCQDCGDDYFD